MRFIGESLKSSSSSCSEETEWTLSYSLIPTFQWCEAKEAEESALRRSLEMAGADSRPAVAKPLSGLRFYHPIRRAGTSHSPVRGGAGARGE